MLIDAPPTLSNTIMHHKHLSHLMAKSMNELAHKSPLIDSFDCPFHYWCEEYCSLYRGLGLFVPFVCPFLSIYLILVRRIFNNYSISTRWI